MEWIPSEEEYNPEITKEQWIEFIQDKNIFNENALITFACIQKAKIATCADMAEEFGRSANFYNTNNWRTGERIFKKINCPLSEREEGGNRFWSVCCLGRSSVQGRWEFKIRPELQEAFEETGMLEGIEVMEKKASFTWIPFYTEMAEKLLEYKDNRKELVKIVYGMDRQFVNYIKDDAGNDYPDIDPFSVFAIFNRKITDERKKDICQYFKNVLQLDSDIPEDFDSIPVMNPQLSVFVWREEISTGIQPIWDLYETVFENNYNSEKFLEHFNIVRNQRGIKWTLTMALYWIRPYEFMPLDSNSREYLQKIGINVFDEKELNGQSYLDLCKFIKEKIVNNEIKEKSIPEISYNAWLKEPQGDTQMTEDTLVKKYANLLNNTKNLILTGAPGTGKTYLAKTIAARLILDREINDFDKDLSEEEKKQVKSQTGFVQFHPSYDYTDFVEGLRPTDKDGNGNVGFERRDGVFKEFCAKALKESYRENNENVDNFEECWERLVEELNENNYIDISLLSGKGNLRVELNEYGTGLANRTYENDDYQEGNWISGKSKFFSKDQLYNIYQGLPGVPAGGHDNYRKAIVEYMKKNLGLLDYKKTESTQKTKKNFVFIIDEINRGEVAKIFGELFYCVDPGYRGKEGKINTQYQNLIKENNIFYSGFFIPENVYIIGTMNDIDRSVESMDFAFRRRFTWAEVKAEDTQYMLDAELDVVLADEAKRRMDNLNAAIWSWDENKKESKGIGGLNEAYHIGASYFLKLKNYGGDFESLWEYHIKGILQEYLRGNPNGKLDDLKAAYDREDITK